MKATFRVPLVKLEASEHRLQVEQRAECAATWLGNTAPLKRFSSLSIVRPVSKRVAKDSGHVRGGRCVCQHLQGLGADAAFRAGCLCGRVRPPLQV